MENNQPRRFLSIRVSQTEFQEIQRQYKFSGCQSLTHYAKKALISKSGGSRQESITCLHFIIEGLNTLENMLDKKIKETLFQDTTNKKSGNPSLLCKRPSIN